jgi:hypothetical protein
LEFQTSLSFVASTTAREFLLIMIRKSAPDSASFALDFGVVPFKLATRAVTVHGWSIYSERHVGWTCLPNTIKKLRQKTQDETYSAYLNSQFGYD